MTKLKNQIEAIKNENDDFQKKFQYYRLNTNTNLLYLKNKFESNRLCISQKFQKRLLKYAHDEYAHDDVHRTYDLLLKSVYMSKMKKTVIEYVTTCSTCQLVKPFRQLSYEQLQSIFFSKKFLFELNLDFIVILSMTFNENNAILTMTDRFSKYVKLISSKKTLSAEKWKTLYWKFIFKNWNIFTKLINDRNFKFNSNFWRTIFKQCGAALNIITIYHFSTNEQIEKSNQIVETALRSLLIKKYEKKWKKILFYVEYSLNVFQNVSIEMFSFEFLYDIKFRNPLLIIIKTNEFQKKIDFMKKKRQIRLDVIDVVKLTQVKMSILFDKKHWSFHLKEKVYFKLIKIKRIDYHVSNQFSLTIKRLKSFVIKRKMNDLTYELILFLFMKIHFVISVIHFD